MYILLLGDSTAAQQGASSDAFEASPGVCAKGRQVPMSNESSYLDHWGPEDQKTQGLWSKGPRQGGFKGTIVSRNLGLACLLGPKPVNLNT